MNKYTQLIDRQEKEMNAFPIAFAFSDKQFEEAKEKLGVKSNDELFSIPGGGFIRKTDSSSLSKLVLKRSDEADEAMKDDEYLYQGFLYELGNHEYCYTGDPESTLDCFGLTIQEVQEDERLKRVWIAAKEQYYILSENY